MREWNTDYLTAAAKYWTDTAVMWEDYFSALVDQIVMPGGTRWRGEAADTAFTRAYSDRLTVIGLADELHEASRIARTGADDISWARESVLQLVDAADNAGYVVGEDFSVTKPGTFSPAAAAIVQAQAQAIADELRINVGTLLAADTALATKLTAATSTLGTTVFPEPDDPSPQHPATQKASEGGQSKVQLVDYKTAPPTDDTSPVDSDSGAAQSGSLQASLANAATGERSVATRLVSNLKQDGGPTPPPPVPSADNPQPQIGPFPVPQQVAAAAARPGAPKVSSDPAAMLAPLDMPDPAPPLNVAAGTPLPPPSQAGTATPKCTIYDVTKAALEPLGGAVGILTAAPEAATGLGVPIALAQIAVSTAAVADGFDAAEKCLG